jgi:hypothetical protein
MEITKTRPQDYIASLPVEKREVITKVDKLITNLMPAGMEKVMWEGKFWGGSEQSIIGYGTYKYVGSNKKEGIWFKVGLTAQKNYFTVFVTAIENKMYVAEANKHKLGKAKVGKSTIVFTKLEDINLDGLSEVITQVFKASV